MLLVASLDQAPLTTTCPAEPWDMSQLPAELDAGLFSEQLRVDRVERLGPSVDIGPSGIGIHKQIDQLDAQDAFHPGG